MPGTLHVVATPIGNLADVSSRSLEVLRSVSSIFCEDTRVTRKLLARHSISTPCVSYHAFSGFRKIRRAIALLRDGEDIALVSDAGTPVISDPGMRFVRQIQDEFGSEANITPIPGPSAVTAALSVSGVPASSFVFLGFLPRKRGRARHFSAISDETRTVALYEAPHRLLKTLASLQECLPSDREVVVAREMTKVHEQVIRGSAQDVLDYYTRHPDSVRGEIVIIVSARVKS